MKQCGQCVYAFFKPVHRCLAPMKVGDSRRDKFIYATTDCFNGMFTESKRSKFRDAMMIQRAKDALRKKEDENV